jgi:hypothetical protein
MAQIIGGAHRGHAAGDTDAEKAASQLVSDIKYKVGLELKRKGGASHMNPAQVAQKYEQKLAASPAPGPVKALAKKKLGSGRLKEDYSIGKLAQKSIVNALTKVFVEGIEEPVAPNEYLLQLEETEEKKYKIRVTDKKTGNNYVRMATRAKISELRANPNISSVEMTNYGEPSETERTKGGQTAKAKSGKGLDPVGREDSDINNNNIENDPSDKYLLNRRKVRGAAIAKEEYLGEVNDKDENTKKLVPMPKDKKNNVVVSPLSGTLVSHNKLGGNTIQEVMNINATQQPNQQQPNQQQTQKPQKPQNTSSINQVLMAKRNADAAQQKLALTQKTAASKGVNLASLSSSYQLEGEELDEKITAKTDMGAAIRDFRSSKSSQLAGRTEEQRRDAAIAAVLTARKGGKKLGEEASCGDEKPQINAEDPRSIPTKVNLLKNKLRAAGMRNPIVMMTAEETDADRAMSAVRANLAKRSGEASILGSRAQKEKQAEQPKPEPQEPRKVSGYSMPGAPKGKSYNN